MRSILGAGYSGGEWDYFVFHGFYLFVFVFRVREETPNSIIHPNTFPHIERQFWGSCCNL